MDHFFQIPLVGKADEPILEGYSALNYLAAVTERAKLGTLVTGVIYRHPGILVKTATTLDVLSGGRAYFGIGASWFEREAKGLGLPFPSTRERFEWLEETLQIARRMWSDGSETKPFEGKHFKLEEPISSPNPVSRPHPPVMVGGGGEKKTLRLVAEYTDACNLFAFPGGLDQLQHKLDVLKGHCDDVGRDYAEVEKTGLGTAHLAPGQMSAGEIVDFCGSLAELGVGHIIFNMPNVQDIEPLHRFGEEIIPEVRPL
ncbi:MAG: LLM class F420-dependent oxidoreductase [Rubrobacter sp.]